MQKVQHRGVQPREGLEPRHKERVLDKTRVEQQVRLLGYSVLVSEADDADDQRCASTPVLKVGEEVFFQFVHVGPAGVHHHIGQPLQHRQNLPLPAYARLERLVRGQGVGPAALGESANEHIVCGVQEEQRGAELSLSKPC